MVDRLTIWEYKGILAEWERLQNPTPVSILHHFYVNMDFADRFREGSPNTRRESANACARLDFPDDESLETSAKSNEAQQQPKRAQEPTKELELIEELSEIQQQQRRNSTAESSDEDVVIGRGSKSRSRRSSLTDRGTIDAFAGMMANLQLQSISIIERMMDKFQAQSE